ncbi:sugar transferase [Sphingomonas sp. S2-65]|uniref:sugar transferase n=1 Tax=Sphingomonas sp. S2-65 TaxID=2903960 RepID=UPI001F3AD54E|nr:sugar transferase [Sphingomonas sp. S2-65]UYY57051.1 sugar transferase [Sphingomonas sp. S2-65]
MMLQGTIAPHLPATSDAPAFAPRLSRLTRTIDIGGAAFALAFFAPILILIVLAMLVGDRGPILFRHERVGHIGKKFYCLKFRTMVTDADVRLKELLATSPEARAEWLRDHKLKKDPRITLVGRFLRVSSLDELPQFWNVLTGEMSLVGPRPITNSEMRRYGRYVTDYLSVRPGITGLWQISGRNNVSYRRRVAMDVTFARSQSLSLYVRILVFTIPAVLTARGSG